MSDLPIKRSPGNWSNGLPEGADCGCRTIMDGDGEEIAFTAGLHDDDIDRGNAYLFSAAADLYDELERKDSALRRIAAALSAAECGEDPIRDAMRDAHRMVYMAMREPREQEFWPWTEGDDRSMPKSPAILKARGYGR